MRNVLLVVRRVLHGVVVLPGMVVALLLLLLLVVTVVVVLVVISSSAVVPLLLLPLPGGTAVLKLRKSSVIEVTLLLLVEVGRCYTLLLLSIQVRWVLGLCTRGRLL